MLPAEPTDEPTELGAGADMVRALLSAGATGAVSTTITVALALALAGEGSGEGTVSAAAGAADDGEAEGEDFAATAA